MNYRSAINANLCKEPSQIFSGSGISSANQRVGSTAFSRIAESANRDFELKLREYILSD